MHKTRNRKIGSGAAIVIAIAMLVALFSPFFWEESSALGESDIQVFIDGEAVEFQEGYGEPFIDANNRTLVPLRSALEAFGAVVRWDQETSTAIVEKGDILVQVPVGPALIFVNGIVVDNDTSAVIREDRTFLPIRAVFEAFGAGVSWDASNRAVIVRSDGSSWNEPAAPDRGVGRGENEELRAMWISYLEYMDMPKNEAGFKAAVDQMYDQCVNLGMNAVIVHVRSHSDAMYPSAYYPWTIFASGTQGVDPGYDPLAYMVSAAHSRGLEFHAWLNPYRVTGYGSYWNQTSASSPVKQWLSDGDPSNDRWALLHKGEYYLNPSVPETRQLVLDGIKEVVTNYEVDGIHFDDYFYPTVNDNDPSLSFDQPEYAASGSSLSIADWRRNNVNLLVKDIYSAVKNIDPNVEFGISPAGNLDNLRRNDSYFVDIDRWLSQPGYVDYIMPQLYWGFERKDAQGNIAAYAYENNLNAWMKLVAKGDAKLYIGLNMANAGTSVSDNNAVSEWLRHSDVIARQVTVARATGKVDGFAFFRYGMFNQSAAQNEVANLLKVLKEQ